MPVCVAEVILEVLPNVLDIKLTDPSIINPSTMTAILLETFFIPETKKTFPNLFRYKTLLERSFTRFIGDSSLNLFKLILLCN